MPKESQEIMFGTAIKRTPVTMVGWMFVGAMTLPGMSLLSGSCSMNDFVVGSIGGCMVAIVLRAVVVSFLSKIQSKRTPR